MSKLFRDRFEITGNNNANEYNLKFKKIDLSDADRYRCTDFDSSDSASAQVLVVGKYFKAFMFIISYDFSTKSLVYTAI